MCLGEIGVVTELSDEGGLPMASVRMGGRDEPVCLMYVPDAAPGDHVLVHLRYAIEVLTDEQAADALELRSSIRGG